MLLYTFISKQEYKELKKEGFLICNHSTKEAKRHIYDWRMAYDFMANKLEQKYSKDHFPYDIKYPRWAYYMWEGKRNLSNMNKLMETETGYFLVINIPKEQVLLSDFDNWHYCLNKWYLPKSEQDFNIFEEMCDKHKINYTHLFDIDNPSEYEQNLQNMVISSWDNIFDLEFPNMVVEGNERSVQACFWVLYDNQIVKELKLK